MPQAGPIKRLAGALAMVAVLAGCGGAASTPGASNGEVPSLKGKSIKFVSSAPPDITDTVLYMAVQVLRDWGADATIDNVQGDPTAVRTVLAGQADVAMRTSAAPDINGSLIAFGPSDPHVDYFMVARKEITSVEQLTGHSFAVSNLGGIEASMYHSVLARHKVPEKGVSLIISGTAAVRVQGMAAGKIDATFAHIDGYLELKDKGFNNISTVSKEVPQLAAGYWSATPAWLEQHNDLAVAIDMAWLKAAHSFQTDQKAYVAAAQAYTKSAHPDAYVAEYYRIAKDANIWPDDGSGFSRADIDFNGQNAFDIQAIQKGVKAGDWTSSKAWDQAVKNVLHK